MKIMIMDGFREARLAYFATFKAIVTDRAVLSVMVGAVVLYSFFYPLGYQQQVASEQPIFIVDQDSSGLSRELIRDLSIVHALNVVSVVNQETAAIDALRKNSIQGYVVIPSGFEHDILSAIPGKVALFANGAWLGRSSTILNGMADAVTGFAQKMAVKQASFAGLGTLSPLVLVQRPLFNTREGYGSAVVTGVAELIIQQTLLIGLAVLAGTRREIYGRLAFSTPQMLGIGTAAITLGIMNMLYYSGFMFWFQEYPQHGKLPAILFASVVFITAVVAFGFFITSYFATRERAFQLMVVLSMPLFFLANISWPEAATPDWLIFLAHFIPSTAGINLFVKITQMDAQLVEVRYELFVLLGLIVLYGGLGWWRYKEKPRT